MAVFTSMYDPMDKDKEKLMNENEELLKDMLDFAIKELEDNEIELINQMKVCDDYQSIFECLKQRALKRQGKGE
ncbi:hypothetical protein DW704_07570 [Coprobacillus sp. AM26-5AC]|jgi:hypothetical protein|uniref:hypothetical protein n=1 Tax=Faecalibacillus intestinalis TaxID=1982626 RepID=UPI000E51B6CD|nr:hypothetical protein [Faecalibacillus intestinalis]RGI01272.1 hypothetical protein DW704_07570 [Coprobacillus sp. AM26-5AC]